MITITLNKIRARSPCTSRWKKLLHHLGKTQADDEEFPLSVVLDNNDLNDALWCCRCLPEHDREWRLFAVWCARQVQHLTTDQRSIDAVDAAEKFAHGEISADELNAAWTAAWTAEAATWAAARAAAWTAGDPAWTAGDPACTAAWTAEAATWAAEAARDAARAAAWTAGDPAWTARDAAWAAWAAAKADQEIEFRRIIE